MKQINDFKFTINVSKESYQNKQDAIACLTNKGAKAISRNKIAFKEQTITIDEFLSLAIKGHAFCNRFQFDANKKYWIKNKDGKAYLKYPIYKRGANKGYMNISFKSDDFFKSAQAIFQDVDFTNFDSVEKYINSLTFKPTCVYMSFSDNMEKHGIISRRFHLVYIFEEELDSIQFSEISKVLMKSIEDDTNEEMDDDCGNRKSQYMNGCFNNNEIYNTNIIYSYNDFIKYINNKNISISSTTLNVKMEKGETFNIEMKHEPEDIGFNDRLLNDYDRLDIEEFFKTSTDWNHLLSKTKYIYRVEKDFWINGQYQLVDDDYFSLFYHLNTVKDGNKRRKTLFERMCLRRIIKPEITPEEMVFNTIIDIYRFFDNSDGVLNSDFIKRNVTNSFALTLEEIKDRYNSTITYLKANSKPKKGIIYVNKKAHTKDTTFLILDDLYDSTLSIKENIEILNNVYLYKIGKSLIYEYLKNRNIKADASKLTDDELISMIDFKLSTNKNYNILKDSGIKVSKKRIYNIFNNYNIIN